MIRHASNDSGQCPELQQHQTLQGTLTRVFIAASDRLEGQMDPFDTMDPRKPTFSDVSGVAMFKRVLSPLPTLPPISDADTAVDAPQPMLKF